MKTAWLTYAWKDDTEDVLFFAQELRKHGIEVKMDRFTIGAGKRLWEQIDKGITDATQSDAWLFYATQNSLGSEPCREEYAYALDRALGSRGTGYPIIGIFPGSVEKTLIPAGIRTRLFVSLTDKDWVERVVAAVEARELQIARPTLEAFGFTHHRFDDAQVFEMWPRAGVWSPPMVAVPNGEAEAVRLQTVITVCTGPRGKPPAPPLVQNQYHSVHHDMAYAILNHVEATPTRSLFAYFKRAPTELEFGEHNGLLYRVSLAID